MGFQLLGIWLYGVIPVFTILGVVSIFIARSDSIVRRTSRTRILGISLAIYLLAFLGFLLDYRCGGPF
jgi:hypothetical protein